ncbi:long-chain-fatty-acid--CoA ligase [Nitrospirillum viridazoti]|nr:long-chain fatty acid--CoA ligase [Nitrospirillum amazonense]TWB34146.1 long-chain acyl-CoA synthetase [Nitrospirillum amazonense]
MTMLWEKSYPPGIEWNSEPPLPTLVEDLDHAVATWPTNPFLICMGQTMDFATFGALCARVAANLAKLGVGPGVHVGLHLPNTPHFVLAFYAVLKAGGVVVPLSPLDAERELTHKQTKADIRLVISFAGLADKLPLADGVRLVVAGPTDFAGQGVPAEALPSGALPYTALLAPAEPPAAGWPKRALDDLATLQFSGGTTGLPKPAMLTHQNLSASAGAYDVFSRFMGLTPGQERMMVVLPLFHIYALDTLMVRAMRNGYCLILHPRWDTDAVLDSIRDHRPTLFAGVPTMHRAIASSPRVKDIDFSSLKFVGSGGAPLPVELAHEFEAATGKPVLEGWGMSETSPAGTITPPHRRKVGSAGIPMPGITIEIRDLTDPHKALGANEKGEICIRGRNVTQGYYKQPEETRDAFIDGLFRTGDIGYLDDDGFMFIVDRRKDMILSGGYNVYPRVVEEAIYEHPAVAEVIVIGIPDSYRGESAKAFVTLRPGAAAFSLEDLRAFLADKLGRHELPAALEFRDMLPKTAVGKLWKQPLVAEERAKAAQGPERVATSAAE